MDEKMLKSLGEAIDTAIKELVDLDVLSKGDVTLQDAKLRPEDTNGTLPGDTRGESILKPEDARKKEDDEEEKKKKEDKYADKEHGHDIDCKVVKKEDDEEEDEEELDDEKVAKLKAKIEKYENDKQQQSLISKSELDSLSEELKKSVISRVEDFQKSFDVRLTQLEGLIQKLASAPQPRKSVSGLAPLAKSGEDVQDNQEPLNKAKILDRLFELQKSDDQRVDSKVIARVEMGDFSVLTERGINLK